MDISAANNLFFDNIIFRFFMLRLVYCACPEFSTVLEIGHDSALFVN